MKAQLFSCQHQALKVIHHRQKRMLQCVRVPNQILVHGRHEKEANQVWKKQDKRTGREKGTSWESNEKTNRCALVFRPAPNTHDENTRNNRDKSTKKTPTTTTTHTHKQAKRMTPRTVCTASRHQREWQHQLLNAHWTTKMIGRNGLVSGCQYHIHLGN